MVFHYLLLSKADGIALLLYIGRFYNQCVAVLNLSNVADVIALYIFGDFDFKAGVIVYYCYA